jgi:hypothetical protein
MRNFCFAFILVQFLAACGGKTAADGDGTGSGTGGTSVIDTESSLGGASGASGGSTANVGGTSAIATGGASTTGGCANTPVTFQVMPSGNSATVWCIGTPASCWDRGTISDASGALQLETNCTVNCNTCAMDMCHPTLCWGPVELTEQGLTDAWDGTYVTASTCGAQATSCTRTNCASPGKYTYTVYAFTSPDPTNPNGCTQTSSSHPNVSISVDFEYPASAPVVVTIPAIY